MGIPVRKNDNVTGLERDRLSIVHLRHGKAFYEEMIDHQMSASPTGTRNVRRLSGFVQTAMSAGDLSASDESSR